MSRCLIRGSNKDYTLLSQLTNNDVVHSSSWTKLNEDLRRGGGGGGGEEGEGEGERESVVWYWVVVGMPCESTVNSSHF